MKTTPILATLALALTSTTAMSATFAEVVNALNAEGYAEIGVQGSGDLLTIDAVGADGPRTLVFDVLTGEIISDSAAIQAYDTAMVDAEYEDDDDDDEEEEYGAEGEYGEADKGYGHTD